LGLLLGRIFVSFFFVSLLYCSSISVQAKSDANLEEKPLRIAVASNFAPTLKRLLANIDKQQQHFSEPVLVVASSGTLFLQTQHGAAFDVFLSADVERPVQLSAANLVVKGSQKTYTFGQLALWSANPATELLSHTLTDALKNTSQRLAIANPKIAPYGKAAKQVLENLQLWNDYKTRLIQGINIGQTFQQVRSQAVPLGIVSNSQLVLNNLTGVLIPSHLHQPIKQQLVILKNSQNIAQAQRFVEFLLSKQSQRFIVESGYEKLSVSKDDE